MSTKNVAPDAFVRGESQSDECPRLVPAKVTRKEIGADCETRLWKGAPAQCQS